MKIPRVISMLSTGALVILVAMGLKACSPASLAPSSEAVETVVQQQLQGTLQSIIAQTQVASQVSATVSALAMQMATPTPQPTVPAPTATPVPPEPPVATDPPATAQLAVADPPQQQASSLTIQAEVNTNCRSGPSTCYNVTGYLMQGQTSTVYGQDSTKSWWYIANPTTSGGYCFVWGGSTHVTGTIGDMPIVTPVAGAVNTCGSGCNYNSYYTNYYNGYYNGNYGCGCKNNCNKTTNCIVKVQVCTYPYRCHWVTINRCDDNNGYYYNGCGCNNYNGCNNNYNNCYNPCQNPCNGKNWNNISNCDP